MSRCFDEGLTTAVLGSVDGTPLGVVDHVIPHRGNQRLFWDEANLQSLCAACHAAKSNTEK